MGVYGNVIPMHRSNPNNKLGLFDNLLTRIFFPTCKALIVQTEIAKDIFKKKYGNDNIIVIPNPVREIQVNNNVKKERIIITVSRLVNGKGLERLIRMFKTIDNQDWKLFILGDGYLKDDLQKIIYELNLEDHVVLTGFQKNVDYYLSLSSIFAFTSESEGYPNALLEAMASGLSCISFDCPTGPSEMIIDSENGYLVPMDDEKQFIEKLQRLMDNENLRYKLGKEAEKIKVKNSFEEIGKKLISELYNLK
jgi:GalNAc-alpha-(1->4)-GalNAc-alpha-(1->3)-diNAcBac-PP-undecaprenol alpha-1,4-N-acetyl-D-galactosaminyltransferase